MSNRRRSPGKDIQIEALGSFLRFLWQKIITLRRESCKIGKGSNFQACPGLRTLKIPKPAKFWKLMEAKSLKNTRKTSKNLRSGLVFFANFLSFLGPLSSSLILFTLSHRLSLSRHYPRPGDFTRTPRARIVVGSAGVLYLGTMRDRGTLLEPPRLGCL